MRLAGLVLLLTLPALAQAPNAAKSAGPLAGKSAAGQPVAGQPVAGQPVQADSLHSQRKAAKLYLDGTKLLEKGRAEEAWGYLKQAAALQPGNLPYRDAAELARQSAVTQLVQQASRVQSGTASGIAATNPEAARLLEHALEIDPTSEMVKQHLNQIADRATAVPIGITASAVLNENGTDTSLPAESIVLMPDRVSGGGKHSFHLRAETRQVVQQVFKAYGIDATVHDSVKSRPIRLDVEDATFDDAMRVLGLVTGTFYEPLDPHRVVVAEDTRANRQLFQRMEMETVYLPGLTDTELTDMSNLARNVFDATQTAAEPTRRTLTLRASPRTLAAFNSTMSLMLQGRSQVDLDVKIIQLARVAGKETGTTFFQQTGVYNVYSEINSVLSQNQSLVQQILSAGLVANQSTLANKIAILAILVASGQLTGTPFNQGFLPFGGGLTQSILSPGPATLKFNINSSDTHTLDDIHLRLGDQEEGTFKTGTKYPIETASYSSVALPASVQALTGTSSASQNIPQVQYEDLGLTLKATPKVLRSDDVALTLDLKIEALDGTGINDIPILANRAISGVVTLRAGETAVLLSDLDRQESRALSGLPGVSDIPGLQDISDIARNQNVARLLILVTPYVVRGTEQPLRGPIIMVDKAAAR